MAQHSDHSPPYHLKKKPKVWIGVSWSGGQKKKEKASGRFVEENLRFLMRLPLQAALHKMNVPSQRVSLNSRDDGPFERGTLTGP